MPGNYTSKTTEDFKNDPILGCLHEVFGKQRIDIKPREQQMSEDEKTAFMKGPIYQLVKEMKGVPAFALFQYQAGVVNINTKILGVFFFESEANGAKEYMEKKTPAFTYEVKPTKLTQYKG